MSRASVRGRVGEEYVSEMLERLGYSIVCRNYRVKGGEIDIIAEKGDTLVFVEVKTRKFGALAGGEEALTEKKRRFIIRTAERYLSDNGIDNRYIRFDMAAVTVTTEETPRVLGTDYYENAFDASDTDKLLP